MCLFSLLQEMLEARQGAGAALLPLPCCARLVRRSPFIDSLAASSRVNWNKDSANLPLGVVHSVLPGLLHGSQIREVFNAGTMEGQPTFAVQPRIFKSDGRVNVIILPYATIN